MISAIEEHDVGWPDFALEVDSIEWILNKVARFLRFFTSLALKAILVTFLYRVESKNLLNQNEKQQC